MSPLYTFSCPSGHEHDALGAVATPSRLCPECAAPAQRQSIYGPTLVGAVRVPVDQKEVRIKDFQEAGAELEYADDRAKAGGDPTVASPSLWKRSTAAAADLKRRGVKDSSDFRGSAYGKVKHETRWFGS